MKKVIAIAIVFAIVAGAAFADTAISGTLETRFTAVSGTDQGKEGANPKTFGNIGTAYLQFSGSNDSNTVGALWRFRNQDVLPDTNHTWHRAFIWWRPIPQLRVWLGIDQDGMYSSGDALTDWAFHQGPEAYLAVHDWGFWRSIFPGHWDGFGLSLSGYIPLPVPFLDNININLTIPTGSTNYRQAVIGAVTNQMLADHLYPAGLKVQSNFNFPDIGKLFITYDGPGVGPDAGADFRDIPPENGNGGYMGFSFLLEALKSAFFNLRLQPGVSFPLVGPDATEKILNAGLGLHGSQGDFGLKFRTAAVFTTDTSGEKDVLDIFFTANIMPWYKLSFMTIYCDVGIALATTDDDDTEDGFGWWVTPYAKVPLGGPSLEFGLLLYSNVGIDNVGQTTYGTNPRRERGENKPLNYAIPLRLVFSF